MIKIGINGFGRIGRIFLKNIINNKYYNERLKIVVINELMSIEMLVYLLKFDTIQKNNKVNLEICKNNYILVNKQKIKILNFKNPIDIYWDQFNVDVILESTGLFTKKEQAKLHFKNNVKLKHVIITAPSDIDVKTVVYNVNHKILNKNDEIISCASCTTNCLAPMLKVLNDNLIFKSGFMSTIHAYTGDQMLIDTPNKKNDFRRSRSASMNIVPNSTGAAKAIGLIIPELNNKLDGSAQRVPVLTGSLVELNSVIENDNNNKLLNINYINNLMKKSESESFGYNFEEIVSSDIIGMKFASLFDSTQTKILFFNKNQFLIKTVSWYDNETSYVYQIIRILIYLNKIK